MARRRRRKAGPSCSRGSSRTAWPDTEDDTSRLEHETALQLNAVLEDRSLGIAFQPIFSFAEAAVVGYEALVRGPEGSLVASPMELFAAAEAQDLAIPLNIVCIQETLRAFSRKALPGTLFLNVSPRLILQSGFSQERSGRFLRDLGLEPARVVIELTEEYPARDFRLVRESLQLYRAMGFRVAIDDLGEGFASLRLWSELRPEFVKADKHFVSGIAHDPLKAQFLKAIQQIAEHCGAQVIAEGIEDASDFCVVKDLGLACGQGYFIGRPSPDPERELPGEVLRASADTRLPVVPVQRLRIRSELHAEDFLHAVDAVAPQAALATVLDRFAESPLLSAIPVVGTDAAGGGGIQGVVSRTWLDHPLVRADAALRGRPCLDFLDALPVRVEADLELSSLAAILVECDARRLADGFVIATRGRYRGMGRSQDVMRALQDARVLAARYTHPLTLLPGQVPIDQHLERLLAREIPFSAWFVEIDPIRGLNDGGGFRKGDALIHDAARLLEAACEAGTDFVGHVAGSRFVVLMQSRDWRERAQRAASAFAGLVARQVTTSVLERGYFVQKSRDGTERVHALPRLAIGVLPVLPGLFESRQEVLHTAKLACRMALRQPGSAVHVDDHHANAYPQSVLLADSP
ncbi:hypothetical protein BWI17_16925 [Betaproteobacteria bacterium GR16-43]|nr:hypothetical protein BWI17_16925 [Betaproteobacteria bacterium GR16-43]